MANIHHAIDYVELTVTDMRATQDFYAAAFGWQFNDYGPSYAGIRGPGGEGEVGGLDATSEGEVGGLDASGEPVRGGPLVLLFSEDLGASVAAVESAGGDVVTAPYAFPGGRRFHFTDPSGNELGVWATT